MSRMKKTVLSTAVSKVKNGHVPLPHGMRLVDGTPVALIPLVPLPSDPPFLKAILKLAKPRDWPADFALNHSAYAKAKGLSKK